MEFISLILTLVVSTVDAGQDYLPNPDQYCPVVHMRCPTGRDLPNLCGGSAAACAFPNSGDALPRCTLVVRDEICSFMSLEDKKPIAGAEFRAKSDCLNLSKDQLDRYPGVDPMLACGAVRHEYTHLSDPYAQSVELGSCTEQVAEEFELRLINAMYARECGSAPTGDPRIHCNFLCGIIASHAANLSWDTGMCGRLKKRVGERSSVTREDCMAESTGCGTRSYWKSFLPKYCAAHAAALKLEATAARTCELAPSGAHGCVTYGGPEIK